MTIRDKIIENPLDRIIDFKKLDVEILLSTLKTTSTQILCKYGYMQLDDSTGLDKYTLEEVVNRMPDDVKVMYWSINNSSFLIEVESKLRKLKNIELIEKTAEVSQLQIIIFELQNEIKNLKK